MEEEIFRLKEVGKEDAAKTETVDYLSLPEYAPFSYNEYVKNPSRKVITRTGIEVHKIEYLPGTDFPCRITLLLPNGSVQCYTVTKDGHEYKSDLDIFFDDTVRIPRYKATSHSETITESSDISDESTDYLKIKREDFEELRSQKDSLMAKVAEIGLELQDCEKANKELRKKISSDNRLIEPTDKELFDILAKRGYFGTLKLCTEVHIGNIGNVDSKKYIYENKTPEETPEGSI